MEAAYQFCAEAARAISPLPVRMRFLFDSDEKSAEFREKIRAASDNRATFLPVRELENLFLDPALLYAALQLVTTSLELTVPSLDHVANKLERLVDEVSDEELYPDGPPAGDPLSAVRGSRVLQRLWWKFALAPYDKVRDGGALAEIALNERREVLAPLLEVVEGLVS